MSTNEFTPRMLETIARAHSMACWWPSYVNPMTEPMWLAIALDLDEVASCPADAEFKAQVRAAANYARRMACNNLIALACQN